MVYKLLSDFELITHYKSGDNKAFEILLKRHKNKVFCFIYNKIRDEELANDFFQEVFIKVINTIKLGTYKDEGKFLSWVLRISNNLIIDYFRKNKKYKIINENNNVNNQSIFSLISDNSDNALKKLSRDEIYEQLYLLIPMLPIDQQEIINLRLFKELSFKEISEIKNISINTCLGRMRYAVLNLRKLINENKLVIEADLI